MRAGWNGSYGAPGVMDPMEPLAETREAIEALTPYADGDLLTDLREAAARVRDLVPECVGISVGAFAEKVTFTLVASGEDVAVLDAVQYLAGGPCVDARAAERPLTYRADDPADEATWQAFARATAHQAVATTLTLPVLGEEGAVVGSINLYASAPEAFTGLHEELAAIFSAWAPGAVTNADLAFRTRAEARQAPQQLRDQSAIDQAVGILASARHISPETGRDLIEAAALRAGVVPSRVACILVDVFGPPPAA